MQAGRHSIFMTGGVATPHVATWVNHNAVNAVITVGEEMKCVRLFAKIGPRMQVFVQVHALSRDQDL
jgi:hypothetical protein